MKESHICSKYIGKFSRAIYLFKLITVKELIHLKYLYFSAQVNMKDHTMQVLFRKINLKGYIPWTK